jgi:hypothetical protein
MMAGQTGITGNQEADEEATPFKLCIEMLRITGWLYFYS